MRRLVAGILILLALVGVGLWIALQDVAPESAGDTDVSADAPDDAHPTRDRVRVAANSRDAEPAPDQTPEEPPPPVVTLDVDPDASAGTVLVVDGRTGTPLAGQELAFLGGGGDDLAPWGEADMSDDPLAAARAHGRVLRTDIDGHVRLPGFTHFAFVGAGDSQRRGTLYMSRDEGAEWTLELWPVVRLQARVVDSRGAGISGVTVALVQQWDESWYELDTAVSDASGFAAVEIQMSPTIDEHATALTTLLPLADGPRVVLDTTRPPTAPVELVLPDTGSLRVQIVDEAGAAWTGGGTVSVGVEVPSGEAGNGSVLAPSATVVRGVAHFPRVSVGVALVVELTPDELERLPRREIVAGPAAPGAEAEHVMTVGALRPFVVGTLSYEDGTPAAGVALVFLGTIAGRTAERYWGSGPDAVTDDAGRFRAALAGDFESGRKVAVHIGRRVEAGGPGSWTVETLGSRTLNIVGRGVDNDLGTITVESTHVVVSGRVVGPDGRPLAHALVVAIRSSHGRPREDDSVRPGRTDTSGAFELSGASDLAEIRLSVTASGHCLAEPFTCENGDIDVVVRMARGGGFAGSVLIPAGFDPWDLRIVATGPATENGSVDDRSWDGLRTQLHEGAFVMDTLRPGIVDVSLRAGWGENDTVLRVDGVEIVEGEITRDPRLQEIDLATLLPGLAVTVLDVDRKPVRGATVHARTRGSDDYWREFETDREGVAHVRMNARDLELLAVAPGHRSAAVAGGARESTVILERVRPTRVTLRLSPTTPLPEPPFELRAELHYAGPLGSDGATDSAVTWSSSDPRSAEWPTDDSVFGSDRMADVELDDPGRYRVVLELSYEQIMSSTTTSVDTEPELLIVTVLGDGSPLTLDVGVNAEDLAKTMKAIGKDE